MDIHRLGCALAVLLLALASPTLAGPMPGRERRGADEIAGGARISSGAGGGRISGADGEGVIGTTGRCSQTPPGRLGAPWLWEGALAEVFEGRQMWRQQTYRNCDKNPGSLQKCLRDGRCGDSRIINGPLIILSA